MARLELIPIFGSSDLDIWSILLALKNHWHDNEVISLVCHKLYTFDSQEVDFFLPQLCQLTLDTSGKVPLLRRFLVDISRRSSRTGILAIFFFQSALADNIFSSNALCSKMIHELEQAMLSGNKNKDLAWQIALYKKHRSLDKSGKPTRGPFRKPLSIPNLPIAPPRPTSNTPLIPGKDPGQAESQSNSSSPASVSRPQINDPKMAKTNLTTTTRWTGSRPLSFGAFDLSTVDSALSKMTERDSNEPILSVTPRHRQELKEPPTNTGLTLRRGSRPKMALPTDIPPNESQDIKFENVAAQKEKQAAEEEERKRAEEKRIRDEEEMHLIQIAKKEQDDLLAQADNEKEYEDPEEQWKREMEEKERLEKELQENEQLNIEKQEEEFREVEQRIRRYGVLRTDSSDETSIRLAPLTQIYMSNIVGYKKQKLQTLAETIAYATELQKNPHRTQKTPFDLIDELYDTTKNSNRIPASVLGNFRRLDFSLIQTPPKEEPRRSVARSLSHSEFLTRDLPAPSNTRQRPRLLRSETELRPDSVSAAKRSQTTHFFGRSKTQVEPSFEIDSVNNPPVVVIEEPSASPPESQTRLRRNSFQVAGQRDSCPVAITPKDLGVDQNTTTSQDCHPKFQNYSKDCFTAQIMERKLRRHYFSSQLTFIKQLTDISFHVRNLRLKDKSAKNMALQNALNDLNSRIESIWGVYIPFLSPDGHPYRVIRIPVKESLCLNSRDRVPYLVNIEVASGFVEAGIRPKEVQKKISNQPVSNDSNEFKSEETWDPEYPSDKTNTDNVLDRIFGDDWEARKRRVRLASPLGSTEGWNLLSVIVKAGDDLRQEQLAMQLIRLFADIFAREGASSLQLRPYMVLATSGDAGLIETVHDAISIHGLKASDGFESLYRYFTKAYGPAYSNPFQKARNNFIESVAAYSLVTYLLQIKDRHNGNILIDRDGRIVHIDYGFMLSSSPGNIAFETSPFKLSQEMVEVMGGQDSLPFKHFTKLFQTGFLALRKNYRTILCTVELMLHAGGGMACFVGGEASIQNLKNRFKLELNDVECMEYCSGLVAESCGNWRTGAYDNFQYWSNGIL